MSTATLGNAAHLLTLAGQKGVTLEACDLLVQTGFQADLFEAAVTGTIRGLKRDAFRKAIGLAVLIPESIILEVDYSQDLEAMIAAGNYNYRNPDITAKRFPIFGKGVKKFEAKLVHPNRDISSDAAEGQIMAIDSEKSWHPAKIEHLLSFGKQFPEEQRKYPIVGLGSVAEVSGDRRVPCLDGGGSERYLYLLWRDYDWGAVFRFLAVREISGS